MEKVECYRCKGKGAALKNACELLCKKEDPDYKDKRCIVCSAKSHIYRIPCFVCDGKGIVDWIDNIFRKI